VQALSFLALRALDIGLNVGDVGGWVASQRLRVLIGRRCAEQIGIPNFSHSRSDWFSAVPVPTAIFLGNLPIRPLDELKFQGLVFYTANCTNFTGQIRELLAGMHERTDRFLTFPSEIRAGHLGG
jgi:hypothetical protein